MDSAKTLAGIDRRAAALGTRGKRDLCLSIALISLLACAHLACTHMQLLWRKPGERNKDFPEKVAKQYHCDERPLPFVELEKSDLVPTKLDPGHQLSHRLIYVMCPATATGVVTGTLHMRILFEGQVIDAEKSPFKLKPGRWEVVDVFDVQEQAQPGVYSFTVEFEELSASSGKNLKAESTFIVKAP